jgi:hypothetical protein
MNSSKKILYTYSMYTRKTIKRKTSAKCPYCGGVISARSRFGMRPPPPPPPSRSWVQMKQDYGGREFF